MLSIKEMGKVITTQMEAAGYSKGRIKQIRCGLNRINEYFSSKSMEYSESGIQIFLKNEYERYKQGELSLGNFENRRKAASFLNDIFHNRDISLKVLSKWNDAVCLNLEYQNILDLFSESEKSKNRTSRFKERIRLIKRFLVFLERKGVLTIDKLFAADVLEFIECCSSRYSKSMGNLLAHIRAFGKYLNASNFNCVDFLPAISIRVSKRRKLQYAFSEEEIKQLLNSADTEVPIDKRNYVIMLLAATTGLRGIDIVNLKIQDIDFAKNELSIVQHKTGVPLTLPLFAQTTNLISEYIEKYRPDNDSEYIFLSHRRPFDKLSDCSSIHNAVRKYIRISGFEFPAGSRIGFHCFRRHLGSELLKSGNGLPIITQILGHKEQQAAKAYLSFDTEKLRECCVDIEKFLLLRGELK